MNFVIKDKEDNEVGPIDQETLEKWIELHKVFPETPIRNALMKNWKVAKDLDFLEPYFKNQMQQREEKAGFWEKRKLKKTKEVDAQKETAPSQETSFRFKYLPSPASAFQRFLAFIFDATLLVIVGYLFWIIGALTVYSGGDASNTFTVLLVIYMSSVIFYYSVCLGVFAQTVGMWYWGIFIVKNDISEVYLFRAYVFALLMLLIGIATPIATFIHPKKRALHDLLTGTRIIRVAAKPKS